VKSLARRICVALVLVVGLLALPTAGASAFSANYCVNASLGQGQWCGYGSVFNSTYNRLTSGNSSNLTCVKNVTAAGNIRGGGGLCLQQAVVSQCFKSATPASQPFVGVSTFGFAGTVSGYTDDSPNHTGCV